MWNLGNNENYNLGTCVVMKQMLLSPNRSNWFHASIKKYGDIENVDTLDIFDIVKMWIIWMHDKNDIMMMKKM